MAGIYGLHYFMFWCVVVASGGAGQSDGGICGGVRRLEALQAQLAKVEEDATASCPVLVPQLQSVASELQLLSTNLTELGECVKITCLDGYQECGGMCYRLQGNTWCDSRDLPTHGLHTVPSTQAHIDCVLDLTSYTSDSVYTGYENMDGANFTSRFDSSVVAPAELVGEPGLGFSPRERQRFVIIDRNSKKLVRSKDLTIYKDSWVFVCEMPPVE